MWCYTSHLARYLNAQLHGNTTMLASMHLLQGQSAEWYAFEAISAPPRCMPQGVGADCRLCDARAPDALYENGLQRHLFLPFIARLKAETAVHDINSKVDYRRLAQHRRGLFYTSHDFQDPDAEVEAQFTALAEACHEPSGPAEVKVMMGRKLPVPQACERCALRGSTPALLDAI